LSQISAGSVAEPDFIAHLQARCRLQPDAALATLASWLQSYEPVEPRRIRVLERRAPTRRGSAAAGEKAR